MIGAHQIRMANDSDLTRFMDYLADQLRDNGVSETPLFQPYRRDDSEWCKSEKLELFRRGNQAPTGSPGWRRFWLAIDSADEIAGHIDLRAHPAPNTSHRALLGMGVHRDHRRRGIGRMLVNFVLDWARAHPDLDWIDLEVLAGNLPAQSLYQDTGFQMLTTVPDMFRIDGESVGNILMTRPVRMGGGAVKAPA